MQIPETDRTQGAGGRGEVFRHIADLAESGPKVDWVVADKAYDSTEVRQLIVHVPGAKASIPVRRGKGGRGTGVHGSPRRTMDKAMSDPDIEESRMTDAGR